MTAGIVLAAGESTRMGKPKQLLEIAGQTMLQRVVDAALASRLDHVAVVLGYHAADVRASLAERAVSFVENDGYSEGLGSSVRAGLQALPPAADAAMFLLGDQPGVTAELINRLLAESTGENIVAPNVGGRRGNPTLFGRKWFAQLARVSGNAGGRSIIDGHPEALTLVQTSADLRDVDTPEDLAGWD